MAQETTLEEIERWIAEHSEESRKSLERAFIEVLMDFDVPEFRRNPTPENMRWLRRNIAIMNNGNQMLPWVLMVIDHLLGEWE